MENRDIFNRTELLVGKPIMDSVQEKKVIVFGVGGVGSWCVEGLVRSGIGHITIVDSDCVSVSNINRQLMATVDTVGERKVNALKARMLQINPEAQIVARCEIYCEETADTFCLEEYDYIIDAIDSLDNKMSLISRASATNAVFFSSMGAALKMDPTKISVAEFWKVKGCPLAACLRRKFKKSNKFPKRKFKCVYSEELLPNLGIKKDEDATLAAHGAPDWHLAKVHANGTVAHITAVFGLTLSGLVIKDIYDKGAADAHVL